MAGKITFRNGTHPSRFGALVEPVKLTDKQLAGLNKLVGRSITLDEVTRIENLLENTKSMRDADDPIAAQDVKATLKAISRLDDDAIHDALDHCDEHTLTAITCALHQMGEPVLGEFARFRPAKLRAAALLIMYHNDGQQLKGKDGPRVKVYQIIFAHAFAEIWHAMTDVPMMWWEANDSASPAVSAAQLLLEAIGVHLSLSTIAGFRKVIAKPAPLLAFKA